MNGITDEVGKVAVATIDSMKSQPLMLGLLLLNAIGIGAAVWFLIMLADHSNRRYEALFKVCLPHLEVPKKD